MGAYGNVSCLSTSKANCRCSNPMIIMFPDLDLADVRTLVFLLLLGVYIVYKEIFTFLNGCTKVKQCCFHFYQRVRPHRRQIASVEPYEPLAWLNAIDYSALTEKLQQDFVVLQNDQHKRAIDDAVQQSYNTIDRKFRSLEFRLKCAENKQLDIESLHDFKDDVKRNITDMFNGALKQLERELKNLHSEFEVQPHMVTIGPKQMTNIIQEMIAKLQNNGALSEAVDSKISALHEVFTKDFDIKVRNSLQHHEKALQLHWKDYWPTFEKKLTATLDMQDDMYNSVVAWTKEQVNHMVRPVPSTPNLESMFFASGRSRGRSSRAPLFRRTSSFQPPIAMPHQRSPEARARREARRQARLQEKAEQQQQHTPPPTEETKVQVADPLPPPPAAERLIVNLPPLPQQSTVTEPYDTEFPPLQRKDKEDFSVLAEFSLKPTDQEW